MTTIYRIQHAGVLKQMLELDYEHIIDDSCPAFKDYNVDATNPDKYFLAAIDKEKHRQVCLIMLYKQNHVLAECHINVFPDYRKTDLTTYINAAKEWVRTNTTIQGVITLIPKSREYIHKFCLKYGWKEKCIIKRAFQKDHILEDCILLELEL